MNSKTLLTGAIIALLYGCGGSDSNSSNAATDNVVPYYPVPNASLSAISGTVKSASPTIGTITTAPNRVNRPDAATQAQLDTAVSATNDLRAEVGLAPLQSREDLAAYASIRARESAISFEHARLDGTSSVDESYFTGYGYVGENLAAGNSSPTRTVKEQWRNSQSHYEAIINANFTHIGLGHYLANDRYGNYWTQIFAGPNIYSIYRYTSPLSQAQAQAAVNNAVQYGSDGQLTIRGSQQTRHSDSLSRTVSDFQNKPYVIAINNDHQLILRPHRSANWSYQTFGEIADSGGVPEAYVNVGQAFVPANDAVFQATYRGRAIGDLGQHSRVIADVNANVNFGSGAKTLALSINNAQRGSHDLRNIEATTLSRDANLDFSDTLTWNSATSQFESTSGNARLYGSNAAELGGQFQRTVNAESYRGAYGAIRTQ